LRQSYSQSVDDDDEQACVGSSFADHEQLWLSYNAMDKTAEHPYAWL
jgi:hypothetical protein